MKALPLAKTKTFLISLILNVGYSEFIMHDNVSYLQDLGQAEATAHHTKLMKFCLILKVPLTFIILEIL